MYIKTVDKFDKKDIKNLWAEAFCEKEPFLSWYFDNFWKEENSLCLRCDSGEIGAALTMIPYDLCVNNTKISSSYIAGVSVPKNHRLKGFAKAIMKEALLKQAEIGEPISLLIPFNYDFYRKMGYEVCYERNIYSFSSNELKVYPEIKNLSMENYREMNEIYLDFCKNKNGYNIRRKKDWEYALKRLFEQNTTSLGYFDNSELSSYVVYTKEKDNVIVHEAIGKENEIIKLLETIDAKKIIVFDASTIKGLKKIKTIPTVMARVTEVSLIMQKLTLCPVKIKINDNFIPENNGVYELGGNKLSDNSKYDIEMDIRYFTQWFMGYKSGFELYKEKNITGNPEKVAILDKLIKKQDNYINLIMSEDF